MTDKGGLNADPGMNVPVRSREIKMKYCPGCKINIEGSHNRCPVCQNMLQGEASEDVYPSRGALKAQSFLYKLQMFIAISVMAAALACEFLLDIRTGFHWSLLTVVWVIGGELWLSGIIHGHRNPGRVITLNAFWAALLVMLTFLIIKDIRPIYFWYIMPAIAIAAETMLFVYMMVDKTHNSMAYLLGCSFLCIIMGILCMLITHQKSVLWVLCLLIGTVGIVGAVVFK